MKDLQNNIWFQLAVVLGLAFGIWYFGSNVWPNTVEMEAANKALSEDITKLQKEVNEGKELEARLPELEREIKAKELEFDNLRKIIPSGPEAEDLIRKLERMAGETSLTIGSFNPQARVKREFYYDWPISMQVSGSFHNLGKFFAKISNYARIINVQSVKMTQQKSANPTQTMQATFTAITYVYMEQ